MKLITVTNAQVNESVGKTAKINPAYIVLIQAVASVESGNMTQIILMNGVYVAKETPDEVEKMIEEARRS